MRTVLIVGPFYGHCDFAPSPAQRLRGYAKYLPEFGWRPVVIAPACRCTLSRTGEPGPGTIALDSEHVVFDPADPDALREALRCLDGDAPVALRPIMSAPDAFRRWAELSARPQEALDELRGKMSWHLTPTYEPSGLSPGRPLLRTVVGAYVRAHGYQAALRRMLTGVARRASGVLPELRATLGSHGYAPHVHAARAVAARRDIPFVAEMRDAIWRRWRPTYEVTELARIVRAVRSANAVVHVTSGEQTRDRWWIGGGPRLEVIEHGFDPDEWERVRSECRPEPDRFTIRFLGTLYQRLHVGPFLRGYVRFLEDLAPEDRLRVRFEYLGASETLFRRLLDDVVPTALRDKVRFGGFVSRTESLCGMASSDVLALPMGGKDPGGRFYEFLGSQRPILAVGEDVDPYVADAFERTGAGVATSDPGETARVLHEWFEQWADDEGGPKVAAGSLEHFTRRRQACELSEVLDAHPVGSGGSCSD